MTGMVERVARALEAKITGKDFVSFEDAARVAIAEMRNIDLDALGAMYEAMFEDKWDCSQAPMVGAGWRAAIDAALQEGKEGGMSDVLKFPDKPEPKDPLVGPFTSEYRVVVEGREIPLLTGLPNGDKEDEMTLCVDRRFMISVPKEYAHRIAWLLAQGIAVASGYSHLGATTKDRPFAPRVHEISPGDIG